MKTKKKAITISIAVLLCFSTYLVIENYAASTLMQRAYMYVTSIEITDALVSGTYTVKFGYKWERIISSLGEEFLTDSGYEDGFSGDPEWENYPVNIYGGITTKYENNLVSDHSYVKDMGVSGYELVMYVKLKKGLSSETETFNIGNSPNDDYDTKYPTTELWFSSFGGTLIIEYYLFDA